MTAPTLELDPGQGATLTVALGGDWLLGAELPPIDTLLDDLSRAPPRRLAFETDNLGRWDTGLLAPLVAIRRQAESSGTEFDATGLPDGARRLLDLAFAVRPREDAHHEEIDESFFAEVGYATQNVGRSARKLLTFAGEVVLSGGRFIRGRATYLRTDLLRYLQEAGAEALPIVSLITFLIGMIFAFVGVMQLEQFGAGIYTADLVAIAMVREMAPIMVAILMAGRTGASYAAQIGTMKVNEEVDALTTLGLDPVDFLVTPRVIALVLMMPMLVLYGSLMGILGGMAVGLVMLDVTVVQYAQQSVDAVELNHLFGGLFKSLVFGSLVAMAGCQQGMSCGGSALAVGQSTTRAVVMGIVLIVVSASVLTVIYINLGI